MLTFFLSGNKPNKPKNAVFKDTIPKILIQNWRKTLFCCNEDFRIRATFFIILKYIWMQLLTEMFDPIVKTQKLLMVALNVTSGCYRRTLLAVIVRQ